MGLVCGCLFCLWYWFVWVGWVGSSKLYGVCTMFICGLLRVFCCLCNLFGLLFSGLVTSLVYSLFCVIGFKRLCMLVYIVLLVILEFSFVVGGVLVCCAVLLL